MLISGIKGACAGFCLKHISSANGADINRNTSGERTSITQPLCESLAAMMALVYYNNRKKGEPRDGKLQWEMEKNTGTVRCPT